MAFILRQEGYDVNSVVDRAQVEQAWSDFLTDLLIFDTDCIDSALLRRIETIRGESSVAMLLLSSSSEAEIIGAYDAGIDDYLAKPYGYGLLLAHVNAQLRRARVVPSALV